MAACKARMKSMAVSNHIHTCTGNHDAGYHWCKNCGRWWWKKENE
jgi:hypothetical protein